MKYISYIKFQVFLLAGFAFLNLVNVVIMYNIVIDVFYQLRTILILIYILNDFKLK